MKYKLSIFSIQRFILLLLAFLLLSCEPAKHEIFESRYPNNAIEWKGTLINGQKTGQWTLYDSLGHLDRIQKYENDTLIYRELYYKNRVLTNEQMKGEDFKHGETLMFYADGTLESRTNFVNNRQFGSQIFYFRNGLIN